jgi:hypothetical protein
LNADGGAFIECLSRHSVDNIRAGEIHLISVELKHAG